MTIFYATFSPDTIGYGKQKIFYDDEHGKMKKMYISDFWFWKLCHREFCQTYWEIFKNHEIMKNAHFLGHFPARNSKIWQIKIISWRSAWKNEENVHLRFLIFETSPQRFLQNILRDFQKSWNYEKRPFSRAFSHQIQLDMPNKKYFLTISRKKWKKCSYQFCNFSNFVTAIFAKHIERF